LEVGVVESGMAGVFDGVRILEVGTWVMVPAAAMLLGDAGASVVKVEHPLRGDPGRGLTTGGVSPTVGSVNLMIEQTNRGKRSIGLDFSKPEGREVLYRLAAQADVFVTSFLAPARRKLHIDVDDIRSHNPAIIYVRADAVGPEGPEGDKPGYDSAVFFGRSGILNSFTRTGQPLVAPRPGFGDKTSSLSIAYGIAAALFKRERTGVASVVDVSLLGTAAWVASSDIVYSAAAGGDFSRLERRATNPIAYHYQTSDGRWIMLAMLESDRWWPDLCRHLGRPDLLADQRFSDAGTRAQHSEACVSVLGEMFAAATLEQWRERLAGLQAPWEVIQDSYEVLSDPQVVANGYVAEVQHPGGETFRVVRSPVRFDERHPEIAVAPQAGQNTEEILLELGLGWDDIGKLQAAQVIA
jgi:crotonobetainyl-CoA:carnitine CoA-transferase CaiB-like acyl-CoA transferase